MPKIKVRRKSAAAVLAEVTKEMAKPRKPRSVKQKSEMLHQQHKSAA